MIRLRLMNIRFKNLMKLSLALIMLLSFSAAAQDVVVKGKVTSTMGESLPGVSVLLKGTTVGTVTDIDGNFSIRTSSADQVLVFSFIGMKSYEALVGGRSVIDVVMEDDVTALEEVVVVGYGTQKKALVTGANVRQDGETLRALNTTQPMEALQGITPGVSVSRNSGQPGSGTKVRIRGVGTIANSNPLYVVDGVPIGNDINYLSPSDIESIDVLKDAASAAIYGSRGANGVVLVTTRKGKKGEKAQITYNGYYGIQNMYKKPPALTAQEYMYIMDEGLTNDGKEPTDWEDVIVNGNAWLETQEPGLGTQYGQYVWDMLQSGWEGTDWVDEITQQDAPMQSHSINIVGATEGSTYSAGVSYFDQTGIIGGDIIDAGYKRLNARLNTEFSLLEFGGRKVLKVGENLTFTNIENRSTGTGNIYWNDLHDALVINPLTPAYWEGSPNEYGFAPTLEGINLGQTNPIATMFYRHNFNWSKGNNIVGNVYAEVEPIQNLRVRSSFGVNSWFGHSRSYSPAYGLSSQYQRQESAESIQQDMYHGANTTWTTTATYDKSVGAHNFSVMIGNEQIRWDVLDYSVGGFKRNPLYSDEDYAYIDNTAPTTSQADLGVWGRDGAANGGGLMSYMGRLSYNYQEKYMVDYTFRRDGSSNFSKDNRYGNFHSVSAGWNFTQEAFFSSLSFIDQGKLRASWGQNGNQDIGAFRYQTNIVSVAQGYYFGSNKLSSSTTYVPENAPNPNVGWETSEQIDIGLDAYFMNSRLSLIFDWYKKTTKDWLVKAPVLGTTGADAPWINGGDVENTGIEFSLGWKDEIGDFRYGFTVSGATVKNKVTRLANAEGVINGAGHILSQGTSFVSRVEEGYPIGYFYGFETDGILQNQEEVNAYVGPEGNPYFEDQRPGDVRFIDQNNDGVIDDNDKVYLGNPIPDFELGIQLNLAWKGIYANMTMAGKFGQQVMRSYRSFADNFDQNYTTEVFGRWHGEGTSDRLPRLSSVSHRNQQYISDIYMHDADFLRINNLTIGYDFGSFAQKAGWFSGAQVYMTVNNLYTFTKYDGMDPEVTFSGNDDPDSDDYMPWGSGIDLGLYPLSRSVMFGVNLTF